ncbi:MAG TPA: hypothetical protein VE242_10450, partial [Chthoniobacterales bacterium]|nr:hypothetical protein [Chthoniobacterales bacterium]
MEIRRDALQQLLRRLSNRLLELAAWRDRDCILITQDELRADSGAPWQPVRPGDPWPSQAAPVEFRFTISIPERWAGYPVHCRFRLGGEALLFLNGRAVAGLNPFHDEHPVLSSAAGGETLQLGAEAVSHGLFGTPTADPRIDLAAILVPDSDVRPFYNDLAAALDGARYHYFAGRPVIAECVLEAVHRAFARISLPRDETEEYLARFATTAQS